MDAESSPKSADDAKSMSGHDRHLQQVYIGLLLPAILGTWFVWLVGGFSLSWPPQWFLGLWFALYYTVIFYGHDTDGEAYRPWHFLGDLFEIVLLYAVAIRLGAPSGKFDGGMTIPVGGIGVIVLLGFLTSPKQTYDVIFLRTVGLGVVGLAVLMPLGMQEEAPTIYWWLVDLVLFVLLYMYARIIYHEKTPKPKGSAPNADEPDDAKADESDGDGE